MRQSILVLLLCLIIASNLYAQIRQSKLYIDDGAGNFTQLISGGAGTITLPALTGTVTAAGNTFNGASQLVQLDGSTRYPALNGSLITALNASNVSSGLLAVGYGGTGIGTYTAGDVLYASGTNTLDVVHLGGAHTVLHGAGSGAPVYSSVDLANDVGSSVLGIANGGTGGTDQASAATNILPTQTGHANQFLQTNGTTASWVDGPSGTVTNVATSTGLTGGPITTTGTLAVDFTGDYTWTGTHTFAPSSDKTSVILKGAAGGTHDMFDVESSDGLTNHFKVDKDGITTIANFNSSGTSFTASSLTATTAAGGLTIGSGANATSLTSTATSARSISFPSLAGTVQLVGSTTTAQSSVYNPTGMSGTSAKMMGIGSGGGGATFTPAISGRVLIITATEYNSTNGEGGQIQICYGSGAAPSNGTAAPGGGTAVGPIVKGQPNGAPHQETIPMMSVVAVTGLSVGTTYWVDVSLASTSASTTTLSNVTVTTVEL